MKKLLLLLVICLGITSCQTSKYDKSFNQYKEKTTYYASELEHGLITRSEYDFLCAQQGNLLYMDYIIKEHK